VRIVFAGDVRDHSFVSGNTRYADTCFNIIDGHLVVARGVDGDKELARRCESHAVNTVYELALNLLLHLQRESVPNVDDWLLANFSSGYEPSVVAEGHAGHIVRVLVEVALVSDFRTF
jgi:hypothetical protein